MKFDCCIHSNFGIGNKIRTCMIQICNLTPKPFSHPDIIFLNRLHKFQLKVELCLL